MRRRQRGGVLTTRRSGLSPAQDVIIPEVIAPGQPYRSGLGYEAGYHHRAYQPGHCSPTYTVDPTAPYAIFTALRAIASSIRRRGPFALAELAIAGYIILAGSAFALNMVAGRPMRLTNVPIFDPTATGANIAWFVRPVVGTAADMSLDAQVDMFSTEEAEVQRDGLGQSRYAVEWE